ncbi:hypothetical protein WOLCODRAFT_154740 [Wolfiporia cocos MD-104 SS10]|uniref:Protein root UVB sensitive/RUS domain-containing protein n=1 Tax=Wolfiporia cocos (strain MD-104) TaxID=742152 RepID=A0A2H3JRX8_WOLCO|nr:hypothetical protein WOLCODRAFT_154740 [Wolfiporia cocos MD-104 SS10]
MGWRRFLSNIFLPAGYPASVSSVLEGESRALLLLGINPDIADLSGHGVGKADASATHAILLTVLQEIFSRLTTVVAGYYLGTSLYPEAKTYRLLADIFNDASIVLDTLSPHLSAVVLSAQYPFARAGSGSALRVAALCASGASRALCAAVAGGSKAALTLHFASSGAINGDVGDLNAKDASKETILALLGMLCGTGVMHYVHSTHATYIVLFTLLFFHLLWNYLAVRVVVLRSLNRQRASIVWSAYSARRNKAFGTPGSSVPRVLTPKAVAQHERIFANPSALYDTSTHAKLFLGSCHIGSAFSSISPNASLSYSSTPHLTLAQLTSLLETLSSEQYLLWYSPPTRSSSHLSLHILMKPHHRPSDHLKAWAHAYEAARLLVGRAPNDFEVGLAAVQTARAVVEEAWEDFIEGVREAGWKLAEGEGGLVGVGRTIQVEVQESAKDEINEDRKKV